MKWFARFLLVAACLAAGPLAAAPLNEINISTFGAKCDGATDDTTAINNAVAALVTAGGGSLFVPAGTCIIGGQVNIRDNITYRGTGWASILKAKSTSSGNLMGHSGVEYDFDINNVVIRDLQLNGNKANVSYNTLGSAGSSDDSYQNCIRFHRVHHFRIENLYIHDCVNNGISLYNTTSDGVVTKNRVENVGKSPGVTTYSWNGIFPEDSVSFIEVSSNYILSAGQAGIYANGHDGTNSGMKILNNVISTSGTNGIRVGQAVTKITTINRPMIVGNMVLSGVSASDPAIRVDTQAASGGVSYPIIANNIVYGNGHRGIMTDNGGAGGAVTGAIVANNVVDDNVSEGIYINSTDTVVSGNVSRNNGTANYTNAGTRTIALGNIVDTTGGSDAQALRLGAVTDRTADLTITTPYLNRVYTNRGAGAGITLTLPASPSVGDSITFYVVAAQTFNVAKNSGQSIEVIGGATGTTNNTPGCSLTLTFAVASSWVATAKNCVWAAF